MQIAANVIRGYTASNFIPQVNGPVKLLFFWMGALVSNYMYQSYDCGALGDTLRNQSFALQHSSKDIANR